MERFVVRHSGKLATGVIASGVVLYNVMEYLSPSTTTTSSASTRMRDGSPHYGSSGSSSSRDDNSNLTLEQARLRAMIENAQQSTWQQNLDNALVAQEKFMLGNERGEKSPAFMKQIEARSQELMQQAEEQHKLDLEKEKKRKLTTRMW